MLDCGIHPGFSGLASLPYLDQEELDTIDAALITHFHLDHCAAVPYLVGRTNFKVCRSWWEEAGASLLCVGEGRSLLGSYFPILPPWLHPLSPFDRGEGGP